MIRTGGVEVHLGAGAAGDDVAFGRVVDAIAVGADDVVVGRARQVDTGDQVPPRDGPTGVGPDEVSLDDVEGRAVGQEYPFVRVARGHVGRAGECAADDIAV